jgi:hypothetical protein
MQQIKIIWKNYKVEIEHKVLPIKPGHQHDVQ